MQFSVPTDNVELVANLAKAQDTADLKAEELKKQYGTVYTLVIAVNENGDDVAIGYLKKPTRPVLGAYMSKIAEDMLTANEIMLKNCLIDGSDPRIMNDVDLFFAASQQIGAILPHNYAVLKKK